MARITRENFDQLLHADTVRQHLERKSVRSGLSRVVAQGVQFVLGVGATMILARLLTPEAYGLRDMVLVLMAFVGSFRDFGLPTAVVNRHAIDYLGMSRLFWINLWLNGALALFMGIMAPVLVWWFREPLLLPATLLMAIGIFVTGLANQHQGILLRQMRHDALAIIEVVSLISGILVAVALALSGFGAWALIWQLFVTHVTNGVATWLICGWLPAGPRAGGSSPLHDLFTFSTNVTAYRIISHIGRNLDRVLIGRFGGAVDMGLYGQAYKWSLFPLQQAYTPLLNVAVSGLSRVQDDPIRYRAYFKRGLQPVYALIVPALLFMLVEATTMVRFVLGDGWLVAIPFFRLLCVAALFESVNRVTKWLYLSHGETARQLHWGLIYTPIMIAAVVVGARWGTMGVALGFTFGTIILTVPGLVYCLNRAHVTLLDFAAILWRPVLAALVAAVVLTAITTLWPIFSTPLNILSVLLLRLFVFALSYLLVWVGLPGGWAALQEIFALLRMVKAKKKAI